MTCHLRHRTLTLCLAALLAGCASSSSSHRQASLVAPTTQKFPEDLTAPQTWPQLDAAVVPPVGWVVQPPKRSSNHDHQVWISPSGHTAYGVIRFSMPLPVGDEVALQMGVLPRMRKTSGDATLLSSKHDPAIDGLRFEVNTGPYRLRSSLFTSGWKGWVVYAGTLKDQPIDPKELASAELARENTRVGTASRPIR